MTHGKPRRVLSTDPWPLPLYESVITFTYTVENQYGLQTTETVTIDVNRVELCGDGIIEGFEDCEHGNDVSKDGT